MSFAAQQLLVCLCAGHFLGDFLLQTKRDVQQKRRLPVLLKHCAISAGMSYLLSGAWSLWQIPVVLLTTHAVIDFCKARLPRQNVLTFVLDQVAHLAVILALVFFVDLPAGLPLFWVSPFGGKYVVALVLVSGLVVCVRAGGILIDLAVAPLQAQLAEQEAQSSSSGVVSKGLRNGGKKIGELERSLIFLLLLIGLEAGIGFLIAAKSILRFGEIKDAQHRMQAEYIIIGSLMSFGYGILVAHLTRLLMRYFGGF